MSRTVTDQARALLERRATGRVGGTTDPDLATATLFQDINYVFFTAPRAALYVAFLARNGLVAALDEELASIDSLRATLDDLGNPAFTVKDATELERARNALLQMEVSPQAHGQASRMFQESVQAFLDKHIAPTVRKGRAMRRTGTEASADLFADLDLLKKRHAGVLQRLYNLAVGVENFRLAPYAQVLSGSVISRTRADIEELIDAVRTGAEASRDQALRLIANRAAVKAATQRPEIDEPVVSTERRLPRGYEVEVRSAPAPAVARSLPGPFAFADTAPFALSCERGLVAGTLLPAGLAGKHLLVADLPGPGRGAYLFLRLGGRDVRIVLGGAADLQSYAAAVNAAGAGVTAQLYPTNDRLLLVADEAFEVISHVTEVDPTGLPRVFSSSGHDGLGLVLGRKSSTRLRALELLPLLVRTIGDVAKVSVVDESLVFETHENWPGAFLQITADWLGFGVGLIETSFGMSDRLIFFGKVRGEELDPIPASDLIGIGDLVTFSTGIARVTGFAGDMAVLERDFPTSTGPVTVTSALVNSYGDLDGLVAEKTKSWVGSRFGKDLQDLERALSGVSAAMPTSRRAEAISVLDALRAQVYDLRSQLSTRTLPVGAAAAERKMVSGILDSLVEKGYDRAVDLLLQCRLEELLGIDSSSVSYGGRLMKAMEEVGKNDLQHRDLTGDGAFDPRGMVTR